MKYIDIQITWQISVMEVYTICITNDIWQHQLTGMTLEGSNIILNEIQQVTKESIEQ